MKNKQQQQQGQLIGHGIYEFRDRGAALAWARTTKQREPVFATEFVNNEEERTYYVATQRYIRLCNLGTVISEAEENV
jgi:hypothetical protein